MLETCHSKTSTTKELSEMILSDIELRISYNPLEWIQPWRYKFQTTQRISMCASYNWEVKMQDRDVDGLVLTTWDLYV